MRLKVQLYNERPTAIPIDHQHALAANIYQWLADSDEQYARMLHEEGYPQEGKRFKGFNFSGLRCTERRFDPSRPLIWMNGSVLTWYISSPLEVFLRHLATGLLSRGEVDIVGTRFPIASVEALAPPPLRSPQAFTCLSPIVASTGAMVEGRLRNQYYTPDEAEPFSEQVRRNLLRKYRAFNQGQDPQDSRFHLRFDDHYVVTNRATKLVDYKGTKIRGAFAPLTLEGSEELIRFAYAHGLGEGNSKGFGMVEVIDKHVEPFKASTERRPNL